MTVKIKKKVYFKSKESLYKWLKQRKHIYRESVIGTYRLNNGEFQYRASSGGWDETFSPTDFEIRTKRFYKYV